MIPAGLYTITAANQFVDSSVLSAISAARYTVEGLNALHARDAAALGIDTYFADYDRDAQVQVVHSGDQFRMNYVVTGAQLADHFGRLLNFRLKEVVKPAGTTYKFEVRHGRASTTDGIVAGANRKAVLAAMAKVPFFEVQTVWENTRADGEKFINMIFTPRWPNSDGHRQNLEGLARKGSPAVSEGDHRQLMVDTDKLKLVPRR